MTDEVGFLFIDESAYPPLDLVSLTGILVPSKQYAAVRDALCRLVRDIQPGPPDLVPAVIELHGRMLLTGESGGGPEADDAVRLRVLGEVVRIVNEHRLEVLRIAYLNRTQIASALRGDPKLYGVTFSGIMRGLGTRLESTLIVPVIDGVPGSAPERRRPPSIDPVLIRAFAGNVRYLHHMRQYEAVAAHLSVENAHNIGEPVFADSAQSVFLQLADLVSHLLLQIDRDELEPAAPQSPYRQAVIRNARAIDNALVGSWRGIMQGASGVGPA